MAGSRKNELRALFGGGLEPGATPVPETQAEPKPEAETQVPAANSVGRSAAGAVKAMGLSLNAMTREAEEARLLRQALSEGERIVAIHPEKIDSSFVEDRLRLDDQDDEDLATLIASMRESGQQVPVLVRNHPEKPGRYQTAYGHRRIRAASRLGLEVKAIVRSLSDDELVLAQGKENAERRNLSFIERAVFARNLLAGGFDRKVIGEALSVQKSELSRLLQVVESVPDAIIRAVGAAPKAGRDRWMKLGELLTSAKARAAAAAELSNAAFQSSASDDRFQLIFNQLSKPEKPQHAEPTPLKDRKGKVFAHVHTDGKKSRIEFAAGIDPQFVEEVMDVLVRHYDAFLSSPPSKG
ncbi:plasmid partitioning protein RepB [Aliirhizobium smilacinae]|uniref:Plasmid partitioning protein RepB n=1 Tax=Aliirhizobium smilacinae TaxID=1395944 RepID=A0A5C4XMZ4_9HYPH|nr:plasmid partitioning protein RepB [Rhizobium smilacinae]TNM64010.1 plasmid partitioning protein RepB [Rhizobium smilacinae]